jgi:hypothetical protein
MKQKMNSKFYRWVAWKLPPTVLLWAVIRAFAYFDSPVGENYESVYKMLVKKFDIKEL